MPCRRPDEVRAELGLRAAVRAELSLPDRVVRAAPAGRRATRQPERAPGVRGAGAGGARPPGDELACGYELACVDRDEPVIVDRIASNR